jgi:hypothetical protein
MGDTAGGWMGDMASVAFAEEGPVP